MRLNGLSACTLILASLLTVTFQAAAQPEPMGTIKIAFGPSWSLSTDPDLVYTDLMHNWFLYGIYRLEFLDVGKPVTFEKLAATEADVVLICNPAGGSVQYTEPEVEAIQEFLQMDAKGIFVSYLLNRGFAGCDDSLLAPLVGVDGDALSSLGETSYAHSNVYDLVEPDHPIFAEISDPWNSGGYPYSQRLAVSSWHDAILGGAQIVAETTDSEAVVIAYRNAGWSGIWVTSMPDYRGNEVDKQFVYNSIVWLSAATHDVALTNVTPSKAKVYEGEIVDINVTVRNEGITPEIFNVTSYYDGNVIGTQTDALYQGTETTLTFSWNTSSVPGNHVISAEVSVVPGETDTLDNTFVDGIVEVVTRRDVSIPGGGNATVEGNVTTIKALVRKNVLHLDAPGPPGSTGWINVTFPMVNTTDIKVFINKKKLTPPPFPIITSNGTHYLIYFEFTFLAVL